MLTFSNAGFGSVLGDRWLDRFVSLGLSGIRADLLPNAFDSVVDELGHYETLSPLFLFAGGDMEDWRPDSVIHTASEVAKKIKHAGYFQSVPVYFEIGNEPDIASAFWRQNPVVLADTYWECYKIAKSIRNDINVITGGISNLNTNGLDWLKAFMYAGVPSNAIIGFHRYPNGTAIETPHLGFESREHEMEMLRSIVAGHKLFCTETGMSNGPYRMQHKFPLCWLKKSVYLSDAIQAAAFKHEWNFYHRRSVLGMVWYQHRDGNGSSILDHYGIYTNADGEKTICDTMREVLL